MRKVILVLAFCFLALEFHTAIASEQRSECLNSPNELGCSLSDDVFKAGDEDAECENGEDCALSLRHLRSQKKAAMILVHDQAEEIVEHGTKEFDGASVPVMHLAATMGGLGIYVDLEVGTPSQVVSVMLDSGSATLGISTPSTPQTVRPCDGTWGEFLAGECTVGSYEYRQSQTSKYAVGDRDGGCFTPIETDGIRTCGFAVVYGDHSGMEGTVIFDKLKLGPYEAFLSFGAITRVVKSDKGPGFQEPPANGIMGVSTWIGNCNYGSIEQSLACNSNDPPKNCPSQPTCRPDAFEQLLTRNGQENRFGICFGKLGVPGVLSLGGGDPQYYNGKMHYTRLLNFTTAEKAFFAVHMSAIGVQGKHLTDVSHNPAIVDTGTTAFWLPENNYWEIGNASLSCQADADCAVDMQLSGQCLHVPGLMFCSADAVCQWNQTIVIPAPRTKRIIMMGYTAISKFYVEFNRARGHMGFAQRSSTPCRSECSKYLLPYGCGISEGCSWGKNGCTGTATGGDTENTATVTTGHCLK